MWLALNRSSSRATPLPRGAIAQIWGRAPSVAEAVRASALVWRALPRLLPPSLLPFTEDLRQCLAYNLL